ncbi:hypothetical protein FRX31_004531 [Thalictrum thalictroides]|uniref:Uncharacterized protein n=1 Tax=Thalictrum thalictroides TaxID=46969 RepID=A0A7J6XBW7_THATH|nr:hypothetical protein FRX31_004531 [Thalictrum thalictroides]
MAKHSLLLVLLISIFFLPSDLVFSVDPSPGPSPVADSDAPVSPNRSPASSPRSPAHSPKISSPPAPAPGAPAKSPDAGSPPAPPPPDSAPGSSPTPSPSDADADADNSNVVHESDTTKKSSGHSSNGMSAGKKAGIVVGVIVGAGLVGLGGFVYKKRQENMRRTQYGADARGGFL